MHARTDKVVEGVQSITSWKKWRKLFKRSYAWNPDSSWACYCYESPSKVKCFMSTWHWLIAFCNLHKVIFNLFHKLFTGYNFILFGNLMGFILECNGWMPLDTGNGFWQVGSIACRFYRLEASPKGSSLERFPTLSKKSLDHHSVYHKEILIIINL